MGCRAKSSVSITSLSFASDIDAASMQFTLYYRNGLFRGYEGTPTGRQRKEESAAIADDDCPTEFPPEPLFFAASCAVIRAVHGVVSPQSVLKEAGRTHPPCDALFEQRCFFVHPQLFELLMCLMFHRTLCLLYIPPSHFVQPGERLDGHGQFQELSGTIFPRCWCKCAFSSFLK
jgi:hypothetical protein